MDWNNLLVILASFIGLGAGYLLALISPEEMKHGEKYFLFLEKALRVLAFAPAVYMGVMLLSWFYVVLFVVGVAMLFFIDFKYSVVLLYMLFAIMIPFTAPDETTYLVQASLVFLYGLPAGSLLRIKHTHNPSASASNRYARTE